MLEIILCLFTNFFRVYIIYKFIHIFVNSERTHRTELLAFGAFYVINTTLFLLFHTAWLNILCNLIGVALLVALYTHSIKTMLFISSSICAINAACDVLSVLLFSTYEDGKGINQLCSVVMDFLSFICVLITQRVVKPKNDSEEIENLPLLLIPLCSIGISVFLIYAGNIPNTDIIVINIGLLFINFLVFYLYNMLHRSLTAKYENAILKQKINLYTNQIEVIMQSEEKVKTLRHDMKHHLNELAILANKNDITALKKYLSDLTTFMENSNEVISSKNFEIDSILNYMIQQAKSAGISVSSRILIPEQFTHSFDFVIILGNLLENAIEAASNSSQKYIDLTIQLQKNVLYIEIKNSYDGILQPTGNSNAPSFYTTKNTNPHQHGIGLNSVRKIVEKYNGTMDIHASDQTFCVKVILYIEHDQSTTEQRVTL